MSTVIVAGLFGGLAMLIYGIRLVGDGLQLAAGGRLRDALSALTSSRVKALLAGAGITALTAASEGGQA
jgi:phosphate:Na+ symporter